MRPPAAETRPTPFVLLERAQACATLEAVGEAVSFPSFLGDQKSANRHFYELGAAKAVLGHERQNLGGDNDSDQKSENRPRRSYQDSTIGSPHVTVGFGGKVGTASQLRF